jgi:hypothetical protein
VFAETLRNDPDLNYPDSMTCLLEIRTLNVDSPATFKSCLVRITGPSHGWPHSSHDVELLSRHYGAQMTGTLLNFETTVYGVLSTEHPARLLQLNQFVTSGLTPAGEMNGYNLVFRREIKAAMNTNVTEGTTYIQVSNTEIHYISCPSIRILLVHPLSRQRCKHPRPRHSH